MVEASQKRLESLPPDHEVAMLSRRLNLIGPPSSDFVDGESIVTGISLNDRTISPTSHVGGRIKMAPIFTPPSADKNPPASDLANVLIGRTIGSIIQPAAFLSDEAYAEDEPKILVGKNLSEILCRMVDKHGLVCDDNATIVDINVPAMKIAYAEHDESKAEQDKKVEKQDTKLDATLTPKADPREHPDMNPDGTIGKIIYGDWRVTHPERWRAHCAKIDAEEAAKKAKKAALADVNRTEKPSTSSCRPTNQPADVPQPEVPAAVHPPAAVDPTLREVTLIDPALLDPAPYMQAVENADDIVWALDPRFNPKWDQSNGTFHQSSKLNFSFKFL